MFKKVLRNSCGFTFVELLVVIAVTVILTTVFVVNTRETKSDDVNRSAKQVLSDVRYARSLATSRTTWNLPTLGTVFPPGGYGISFADDGSNYTIFAESGQTAGYQATQDGRVKLATLGDTTLKLEDYNQPVAGGTKYFTFKSADEVSTNFAENTTTGDFKMAVYYQSGSVGYKGVIAMGRKADDGSVFVSLGLGGMPYTTSCSIANQACDGSQPCCGGLNLTCTNNVCKLPVNNPPPQNYSCLPAGTKILMADNSTKNIEDVKVGDYVMGYNTELSQQEPAEVLGVVAPFREHMCEITFVGSGSLQITNEHPIYTSEGWKSINPERTESENEDLVVTQLDLGDEVLSVDNQYKEVAKINCWQEIIQTYNLESVANQSTFFADGVLVHNAMKNSNCSITNTADPASDFGI